MARLPSALAVLALVTAAGCMDNPAALPGSEALHPSLAAVSVAEQVMPGEVIVATVPGVDVAEVAAAHGLAVAERGYRDRFFVLRGAVGGEQANARALGRDARVRYAEPNYLRQPTSIGVELLVIASAGNGGQATIEYPAADARAISVAATTWRDKFAAYSNWGDGLDIAAPAGARAGAEPETAPPRWPRTPHRRHGAEAGLRAGAVASGRRLSPPWRVPSAPRRLTAPGTHGRLRNPLATLRPRLGAESACEVKNAG